jgi:hypothetical protein
MKMQSEEVVVGTDVFWVVAWPGRREWRCPLDPMFGRPSSLQKLVLVVRTEFLFLSWRHGREFCCIFRSP